MATLNAGSGADGNATVSANKNISTESLVGRGYADMISYNCSSIGSNSCVATVAPDGIAIGDEILLINLQGITGDYGNVGNYETFIVDDVSGTTITFATSKTKNYGNGSGDTNIGILTTNQRVMVQRVPQYADLTIDNGFTLSCDVFDKLKGGVLFFRTSGTLTNNGTIFTLGIGNKGGYSQPSEDYEGEKGDSLITSPGLGIARNLGGGGGGGTSQSKGWGGGGGGYGTAAADVTTGGNAQGGTTYGETTLSGSIYLGSGGGGGGHSHYGGGNGNPPGGKGGGIVAIFTTTLHNYGTIDCDGQTPPNGTGSTGGAGGGSGGSILIHAGTWWSHSSSTTADGGLHMITGTAEIGTDGGDGRISIHYATLGDGLTGVSPTPYTDDTLELPYNISGTASADCTVRIYDASWSFVKSQAVSAGAYQISNLPSAGPFNVVSDPDSGSTNIISYKGVTPSQ